MSINEYINFLSRNKPNHNPNMRMNANPNSYLNNLNNFHQPLPQSPYGNYQNFNNYQANNFSNNYYYQSNQSIQPHPNSHMHRNGPVGINQFSTHQFIQPQVHHSQGYSSSNQYQFGDQRNIGNPVMNNAPAIAMQNEFFNPPYTFGNTMKSTDTNVDRNKFSRNDNQYNNYKGSRDNSSSYNTNNNSNRFYTYDVENIKFPEIVTPDSTETDKWLAARKRNFPFQSKANETEKKNNELVKKGLISQLELKLREKISLINRIDNKKRVRQEKKEFEALKEEMSSKYKKERDTIKSQGQLKRQANLKYKTSVKSGEIEEGEILSEGETKEKMEEPTIIELKEPEEQKLSKHKDQKKNKDKHLKYSFSYRKNTILNSLFKTENKKELNIILQAFHFFEEKGLLN